MELTDLLSNKILVLTVLSGLSAQIIKVLLSLFSERRLNFRRLFQTGGLPSSHSASVATLATVVGVSQGFSSLAFAISIYLCFIVMYEAAGLRRAAGRHARLLNQIVERLGLEKKIKEKQLRELLGHSPFEVLVGAIFGILFALTFW
ncbi:MAG: divergent PAP2 family protein [Candidatus Edwardsbacteria bacterium]